MKKLLLLLILLTGFSARADRPFPAGPTVVLTFDDATASQYDYVAPLLRRYGFGATFYICEFSGFENKRHYMSWQQIRRLSDMGFEIGNHTRTHAAMSRLQPEQITAEIAYIEDQCARYGIPRPVTFAYPGYDYSEAGIALLRQRGYRYARHGGDKPYRSGCDPLMLPSYAIHEKDGRTLAFLQGIVENAAPGDTIILCFHGVPDLAHDWVNTQPRSFKAMMKYLKQHNCRVIALKDL